MNPRLLPLVGLAALLSGCSSTTYFVTDIPQQNPRATGWPVLPDAVRFIEAHELSKGDRLLGTVQNYRWPLGWFIPNPVQYRSVAKKASESGGNAIVITSTAPDLFTGKNVAGKVYYVFDDPAPAP